MEDNFFQLMNLNMLILRENRENLAFGVSGKPVNAMLGRLAILHSYGRLGCCNIASIEAGKRLLANLFCICNRINHLPQLFTLQYNVVVIFSHRDSNPVPSQCLVQFLTIEPGEPGEASPLPMPRPILNH